LDSHLSTIVYHLKDITSIHHDKFSDEISFMGECIKNIGKSRSQNFQDVWALYETDFKYDGFFVEFGATNGIDGSNTYLLEQQYDWCGILAEPNPDLTYQLVNNRLLSRTTVVSKCVYTETGKTLDFNITDEPDLSTIVGFGADDEHKEKRKSGKIVKVDTISLYDLLNTNNAPMSIDYISVDTEGSEYDILKAFFLKNDKYDVKCFTVEHNFNSEKRRALSDMFYEYGYRNKFPEFSRWDDFYIKAV
jgi:FkbM family methyltransferase